jgi:lipopolysaccharide export system permease protein
MGLFINQKTDFKMNVLTLYLGKEILKGSLITMLILLTIFNLFTLADELKDIDGHYGLKEVFYFVSLTSPTVLYQLVPASALIGSLFVLGNMGNHRELIAMQAAGLSVLGIIKAVLLAGLALVILSMVTSEFIAPVSEKLAQKIKASTLSESVMMNSKYGVWLREDSSYINIRQAEDDGVLADISIYDLDDQRHLYRTVHADKAIFLGNKTWKLVNVKESAISTQQIQVTRQAERIWKSSIAPNLLKIVVVDPNNLSLYDLAMYVKFLRGNHQKSHIYEVAFWGRAISPLTTFVMMLVSAPFVIGIHRGVSVGTRVMIGVTIGMGFNIFDKIINHVGLIYNLNPPLMAILPSLAVFSIVLYTINKARTQ